jgi:hypothetical protein
MYMSLPTRPAIILLWVVVVVMFVILAPIFVMKGPVLAVANELGLQSSTGCGQCRVVGMQDEMAAQFMSCQLSCC